MSKSGGAQKLVYLLAGGLIGFVVGYATTYQPAEKAGPVAVEATSGKAVVAVNAKPVRTLEASPMKGSEAPKILIHEVSEFQ